MITPILQRLRDEKDAHLRGGIYHRTQVDFAYNSNHIEGSRLTHIILQILALPHKININYC